jgi:formate hydrogenlyase subunit 6/NADH:ubiquinone oxidoreductase subunit I
VQERFRGILGLEPGSCIADHACERVCPVDCIQIEDLKGPKSTAHNLVTGKDVPKVRHLTRFDIHIGRCMYCGLCVDQCPTGALHFTRQFAGSTLDYKTFIRKFVTPDEAEKVRKMAAEEEARKKAEEAKKAAEAPAEKSEPDKGGAS